MNIPLTEKQIRERASEQSFQKGLAYYKSDAIYNPARQATPSGITLTAQCEGSSAPSYRLQVALDGGGVRAASCTCPYDWGGDCKHIVALLLMYIHQPDEFSEQKSVKDLLAGLEKDALVALILRLVERDPDLYDALELAIPAAKITAQSKSTDTAKNCQTQISEEAYRKQVNRILKQSRYRDDYYDELYPIAARWLERAKKAYHQKGQDTAWQSYIDNLRMTYARRPALQREIQGL